MPIHHEEALFQQYKPLLFSIAYRMLGSVADAEDIVQDTFLSYYQLKQTDIDNPKAYLCKIATNLCLDTLKSARRKREAYLGPWLPEPLILVDHESDPLQHTITQDSLSMTYLLMMEKLSPTERAVFILREVFHFSYEEIASFVNKSVVNCRKILTRAKQKLDTQQLEQSHLDNAQNQGTILAFIQAFQSGNMEKVLSLLSEKVTLYSDGGGIVKAAINPITTRDRVLPFLLGIASKAPADMQTSVQNVNGQLGVINSIASTPHSVISFLVEGQHISEIYIVMNPEKLTHIKKASNEAFPYR